MTDNINHPAHYQAGELECIDVMQALYGVEMVQAFCLGNAFKYLWRCGRKHNPPDEDMEKAIWYLKRWLEIEKERKTE